MEGLLGLGYRSVGEHEQSLLGLGYSSVVEREPTGLGSVGSSKFEERVRVSLALPTYMFFFFEYL